MKLVELTGRDAYAELTKKVADLLGDQAPPHKLDGNKIVWKVKDPSDASKLRRAISASGLGYPELHYITSPHLSVPTRLFEAT